MNQREIGKIVWDSVYSAIKEEVKK